MAIPTGDEIAAFLGRPGDAELVALATVHLSIVSEMVRTYTRGVGFDVAGDPNAAMKAVIISATARLTANPEGVITEAVDDFQTRKTVFEGFSLAERMVLDQHRRRAA